MLHVVYTVTQVTSLVITEVRSVSFGLVTERHHYNACPIYASNSVAQVIFFIVECGIVHSPCYARIRHSGIILNP